MADVLPVPVWTVEGIRVMSGVPVVAVMAMPRFGRRRGQAHEADRDT
jgi:hypothetical protein